MKYERQLYEQRICLINIRRQEIERPTSNISNSSMNQRLYRMVDYFRNYRFKNDPLSSNNINLAFTHPQQRPPLTNNSNNQPHAYQFPESPTSHHSSLQTQLQESILNAQSLISLYEQKLHQTSLQNDSLLQEIDGLKQTILEDKKETDKLLDTSREIIEELRKQLMEKDQDNKILNEKVEHMENAQFDQLTKLKKQQNDDLEGYQTKLNQEKLHYRQTLNQLRRELEDEKQYNSQLMDRVNQLTQEVEALTEENHRLLQFLNCQKDQESLGRQSMEQLDNPYNQLNQQSNKATSPHPPHPRHQTHPKQSQHTQQPFIPHLQITDKPSSSQYFITNPINDSSDQMLNSSYEVLNNSYEENPTMLKDVLNCSGEYSSRFTINREYLVGSKEKENVEDNFGGNDMITHCNGQITHGNSNKITHGNDMTTYCNNSVMAHGTISPKKQSFLDSPHIKTLLRSHDFQHPSIRRSNFKDSLMINNPLPIREFNITCQPQFPFQPQPQIDPYYIFFVLTAQCVKINSEYFQQIAEIDIVEKEWNFVVEERVPMNLWAKRLEQRMLEEGRVGK